MYSTVVARCKIHISRSVPCLGLLNVRNCSTEIVSSSSWITCCDNIYSLRRCCLFPHEDCRSVFAANSRALDFSFASPRDFDKVSTFKIYCNLSEFPGAPITFSGFREYLYCIHLQIYSTPILKTHSRFLTQLSPAMA